MGCFILGSRYGSSDHGAGFRCVGLSKERLHGPTSLGCIAAGLHCWVYAFRVEVGFTRFLADLRAEILNTKLELCVLNPKPRVQTRTQRVEFLESQCGVLGLGINPVCERSVTTFAAWDFVIEDKGNPANLQKQGLNALGAYDLNLT